MLWISHANFWHISNNDLTNIVQLADKGEVAHISYLISETFLNQRIARFRDNINPVW